MSMTDPIADFLTRIRNASSAGFESVTIPNSKLKEGIVKILKEEGYVKGYETVGKDLVVALKYSHARESAFEKIIRVSKPGHRIYVGHGEIRAIRGGLGMAILSTPKGILTDAEAKKQKVGGEWLCTIW